MNLRMKASRLGGTDLLAVSGSLDFSNAEAFRDGLLARIQAEDAHRLIVDFSGVEYISSAGLRVLMIAAREARARGVTLALAALRPVVAEILQISRFDTIFACHASVQDAVDAAFDPVDPARASAMQAPRQGDAITVRFWGTRGSLPAPLGIREFRHKLASALVAGAGAGLDSMDKARDFVETLPFRIGGTYGGNSSCVALDTGGDRFVLLDFGSGSRPAGLDALRRLGGRPGEFHVFMSHLHWDHIMGFPFFAPAYMPGQTVRIYGCHANIEQAFRRQQDEPSFPVGFERLGANIEFVVLEPGRAVEVAGYWVTPRLQLHGGDSYAYRFERAGRTLVYSTDAEHKPDNEVDLRNFVELFRDADLVIFDAMYSLAESVSVREDWGHSSNVVGVELCQRANVKRLALFHHEPVNDDAAIDRLCQDAQRLEEITRKGARLDVLAAYDGLELLV